MVKKQWIRVTNKEQKTLNHQPKETGIQPTIQHNITLMNETKEITNIRDII